jgi:hypothetical protein
MRDYHRSPCRQSSRTRCDAFAKWLEAHSSEIIAAIADCHAMTLTRKDFTDAAGAKPWTKVYGGNTPARFYEQYYAQPRRDAAKKLTILLSAFSGIYESDAS